MATQNQINWMRNVEERRHNIVSEYLDKYKTDSQYKSNIYSADRHLQGTIYSAEANLAGTKYSSDKKYLSDIYSTDKKYASDIYSTDKAYASSIYASNKHYDASVYSADKHYASTVYSADKSFAASALNAITSYNIAQERNVNQLMIQGISTAAAKYAADKHLEGTKYSADKSFQATRYVPGAGDVWYSSDMSVAQVTADKNYLNTKEANRIEREKKDNQHGEKLFNSIIMGIGSIIPF